MAESPTLTPHRCPKCGLSYPADVYVCPECQEILDTPKEQKRTPVWLIVLLSVIIAILFVWACLEAYRVFVLRQY